MASLIELVEQVNRGDDIASDALSTYQQSSNSAERFLAYHAGATLGLRQSYTQLHEALAAIGYSDRKVLEQFVGLCSFLGREGEAVGPTVSFGRNAVSRGELSLGLEAASSVVAQDLGRGGEWSKQRENLVSLGGLYRDAADATGWTGGGEWTNTQPRIGYVVSALGDDEPAARAAAALAGQIDAKRFRLNVYATEAFVRRDGQQWAGWAATPAGRIGSRAAGRAQAAHSWINNGYGATPSAARGQGVISRIREASAGHWIAPTSGDVITAATALAEQIVADQTDVLVIDADITDPIAAMVVSWRVAHRVLWIARRTPLYSDGVDSVCYLNPAGAEADRTWWEAKGITPATLVEGIDLAATAEQVGPRRQQYGIPDSAVICATAVDDVAKRIDSGMVDAVIQLLRRQPQAVFLLIGSGDTSAVRRQFEAAGIGKRVGYAGRRRDLGAFVKMADIYLCPFASPETGPASAQETLAAMGVGLPVVALSSISDVSTAADPVGEEGLVQDLDAWLEQSAKLVRDGASRRRIGQAMRRRVEKQYSYATTARGLEKLITGLLGEQAAPAEAVKQAA